MSLEMEAGHCDKCGATLEVGQSAHDCDLCQCQNCDWRGPESDCKEIKHLNERVASGEPMPCGECPKCGALCQPVSENEESTEEQEIAAFGLVQQIAGMKIYGEEMEPDGDDAMTALSGLIRRARIILKERD